MMWTCPRCGGPSPGEGWMCRDCHPRVCRDCRRDDGVWVRFVPGETFSLPELADDEYVTAAPPDGWDVYRRETSDG